MNTIKSTHHQIFPPDAIIAELEDKAAEYEERSANEPELRLQKCENRQTYIEDGSFSALRTMEFVSGFEC